MANPVALGFVGVAESVVGSIAAGAGHVYVPDSANDRLQVVDVTDPSGPVVVGEVALPTEPREVAYAAGYCYVSTTGSTLLVVNVSTPSAPAVVGSLALSSSARAVAYDDGLCYAAVNNQVIVVDVSTPSAPAFERQVTVGPFTVGDLAAGDGRCYAVASQYLYAIDPDDPLVRSVNDQLLAGSAVAYDAGYCYVAAGTSGRVTTVDVGSAATPTITGAVSNAQLADAGDIAAHRGQAWVAARSGDRVVQLNVSNPTAPVVAGGTTVARPEGVAYDDLHLYVYSGSGPNLVVFSVDVPPNAPILTSLVDGGSIDRGVVNRASHIFDTDDPGDSQSGFDLRYRIVGSGAWTVINRTTPNHYHDFAAGVLPEGDYERQVRVYGASGLDSPWSPSGFFTAATLPDAASLVYPVNGQSVQPTETVVWSTPTQDAYQVRRLGDVAGGAVEGVLYFDTGRVDDATARTLEVTFAVNDRAEHVQVRVENDGLWSPWATVRVEVSYTPPSAPSLTVVPDEATGSLLIGILNPDTSGEAPAAAYNDVWINDGTGFERKAAMLPTNTDWRYWTPRSGRDYAAAVRVVAVAPNGAIASSDGGS